jgi:hypothetical protein
MPCPLGDLVQVVALVGEVNGLDPIWPMGGKIRNRHRTPLRRAGRRDFPGKISAVKRLAFGLRDSAQRLCLIGEAEQFTCSGRATARHEGFAKSRLTAKPLDRIGPLPGDHGRN